jgi:hypothetical protein
MHLPRSDFHPGECFVYLVHKCELISRCAFSITLSLGGLVRGGAYVTALVRRRIWPRSCRLQLRLAAITLTIFVDRIFAVAR